MRAPTFAGAAPGSLLQGSLLRGSLSRVGLLAAVLLCTLLSAAPATAATGPSASPSAGTTLPQISQTLQNGQGCVTPSTQQVQGTPWAQLQLDPQSAWQLTEGAAVTVGVVDTGFAGGSPQLVGQVTLGPDESVPGAKGTDCVGHGTFVAGLIAARPEPGTTFAGIAPQAHIYAVAVTDQYGVTTPDQIGRGIVAAVNGGARVVDVSVVAVTPSPGLQQAVAYASSHGALVVAPATADGQSTSGEVYPAAYPGVLSVADVGPADSVPNTGITGTPVDLVAPGYGVTGIGPGGSGEFVGSGASFAAALVAGAAALVSSYRPDLTPTQLSDRLEATAYRPGDAVPDSVLGYGAIDPYAAISAVLPEEYSSPSPLPPPGNLAVPVPSPKSTRGPAFVVVGLTVAVVAVVVFTGATVRRGRRRGWRPGTGRRFPDG